MDKFFDLIVAALNFGTKLLPDDELKMATFKAHIARITALAETGAARARLRKLKIMHHFLVEHSGISPETITQYLQGDTTELEALKELAGKQE